MENKNSEELIYLKNALRKAESEKEKINAERGQLPPPKGGGL